MGAFIKIKGIRKWRIYHDDLNWIIQERKPKNKPPNDWVNKYFFSDLDCLFKTLLHLGVAEEKLSDFKAMKTAYDKKCEVLSHAIQKVGEEYGIDPCKPPSTAQSQAIRKANKKRSKKPKGRASAKKGKKTKVK